jgi:serine/threonine protein phosphatase 1
MLSRLRRKHTANEGPVISWLKTLAARSRVYPAGPLGLTIYAIGDIHGRSDCLAKAHRQIDRDVVEGGRGGRTVEVYLGDYFDRGPDSRGVIDQLLKRSAIRPTILLRGNHESIMESFLRGRIPFEDWRQLGGLETILSYGVDARALLARAGTIQPRDLAEKLPVSHMRFFSTLRYFQLFEPYCFVHAGLRPGVLLAEQSAKDLVWIRDEFLNFSGSFGHIVIHGHTPVNEIELLSNRVNIDTGAYATNRLSVIRIDEDGLAPLADSST